MKSQPKLTWYSETKAPGDQDWNDEDWDRKPYWATPRQEARYRRFEALVSECRAEIAALKKMDPEGKSDQMHSLRGELAELVGGVAGGMLFNYRGVLDLHPHNHPGHLARVLAGKPRKGRLRYTRRPTQKPHAELRVIRGGKG